MTVTSDRICGVTSDPCPVEDWWFQKISCHKGVFLEISRLTNRLGRSQKIQKTSARWFNPWSNFIPDRWRSPTTFPKGSRELTIPKGSLWITSRAVFGWLNRITALIQGPQNRKTCRFPCDLRETRCRFGCPAWGKTITSTVKQHGVGGNRSISIFNNGLEKLMFRSFDFSHYSFQTIKSFLFQLFFFFFVFFLFILEDVVTVNFVAQVNEPPKNRKPGENPNWFGSGQAGFLCVQSGYGRRWEVLEVFQFWETPKKFEELLDFEGPGCFSNSEFTTFLGWWVSEHVTRNQVGYPWPTQRSGESKKVTNWISWCRNSARWKNFVACF